MKKTSTAILTIASFLFAGAAFATNDLQKEYNGKYPDGKAKKGEPNLNPYGKEFGGAIKDKKVDWTKVKAAPAPKA